MRTKTLILLFVAFIFIQTNQLFAGPGDTIRVKVFDYSLRGDVKDKWIVFPDKSHTYEKILMNYSLKCDPLNKPYKCGEWDYLTYTYASKKTGKFQEFPNFKVDNNSLDSFIFMFSPSYKYAARFEKKISYTNYFSQHSADLTDTANSVKMDLFGQAEFMKSQFLWKKGELEIAGLNKNEIQGIYLKTTQNNQILGRVVIRMKLTSLSSIDNKNFELSGFTTVFDQEISFPTSGSNYFAFENTFQWDSLSNIIVEFLFYNKPLLIELKAQKTSFNCGISSISEDYTLNFEGLDYVNVPTNAFNNIDKEITVTLWQWGNPKFQPQDNSIFEGIDTAGVRVINSHLPWSNGHVYWDAGKDASGYDRIEKLADTLNFENKWNFWAFTKNTVTGEMNMYLNGSLFLSGTGKTKSLKGISKFRIGSNGNGNTYFYDGKVDEFTVWNKVLDINTINDLMFNNPENNHPFYNNLIADYSFDEGNGLTTNDQSKNKQIATLTGIPSWQKHLPETQFKGFNTLVYRPEIIFDQGTYSKKITKTVKIDSVENELQMLVLYNDFVHPNIPTDTLYIYPTYSRPIFDTNGLIIGSIPVAPDSLIFKVMHAATYDEKYSINDRYEIGRYITPYGINLDLGEGFKWVYDVSDYATILVDSVRIQSGNWQELHELEFLFIEGTPPRNPLRVINLWNGFPAYNANAEKFLKPLTFKIEDIEKNVRLKMRTSGHGMGGNDNCAEFCPKTHTIDVNGVKRFDHFVWRDNCASNPLYPQGGTWIYQRANWCPGAEVYTHDFELTPYSKPGDSITVDYNFQPYVWNGQGSQPNYVVASQLVTYSDFNFNNDAAILEIINPNNWEYYLRENNSCQNPKVIFQNTGLEVLTSLKFSYGSVTTDLATYRWTGNLEPLATLEIELPFYWGNWDGDLQFRVKISEPNGKTDEYEFNNQVIRSFKLPPAYKNELIFYLKTNNAASETSYKLTDASGKVLYSRDFGSLTNSKMYSDTFRLANTFGCYKLEIFDNDEDGLNFWANSDGNGTARLKALGGSYYPAINPDFGAKTTVYFSTGWTVNIPEIKQNFEPKFSIFPNPGDGHFYVETEFSEKQDFRLVVFDMKGNTILEKAFYNSSESLFEMNLENENEGLYIGKLFLGDRILTQKFSLIKN